jgi:hypothetical protein
MTDTILSPVALREQEPSPLLQLPALENTGANLLRPRTPEEFGKLATIIMDAGMIPEGYAEKERGKKEIDLAKTRAKLVIAMIKADELGIPPITGLAGIMVIGNRAAVYGDLAIALVHRTGKLRSFNVEQIGKAPKPKDELRDWPDDYGWKITIERAGISTPYVSTFTVTDAKRAGLWAAVRRKNWLMYPKDMLFRRSLSRALKISFADALDGLQFVDDLRDVLPPPEDAPALVDLDSDLSDDIADEPAKESE